MAYGIPDTPGVMTPQPSFIPVDWNAGLGNFNSTYKLFLRSNPNAESRYGSANTRQYVADQMWNAINARRFRGDRLGSDEQWFLKQGYNDVIGGLVPQL